MISGTVYCTHKKVCSLKKERVNIHTVKIENNVANAWSICHEMFSFPHYPFIYFTN